MSVTYLHGQHDQPSYLLKPAKPENPFIEVTDSIRLLIRLVIAGTIALGWILGLMGEDAAPFVGPRLLMFTLATGVSTLPLWWKLPGVGILHPLFIISSYTFLKGTLPSISHDVLGLTYHPGLPTTSPKQVAILQFQVTGLYMAAQIMTYIGFFTGKGISWSFIRFRGRKSVVVIGTIIALILSSIAFYLLIDVSGGLYYHLKNIVLTSSAKKWVKDPQFVSIYVTLCGLIAIPPALWMLVGKRAGWNPLFWALTLFAISAGFITSGRRSGIVGPVVILTACWILKSRKISITRLGLIWLALFLSIGILGEYRTSNWDGRARVNFDAFNTDFNSAFQQSWEEIQARRGGSPTYLILEQVPDQVPYKYGINYVNYVNRFIPRRLWRDKPRGLATEVAEVFYERFDAGAIPAAAEAEAYWSGGLVAVVIVFYIWGRLLCSIGTFFVRFRHSAFASLLYLATVIKLNPSEVGFAEWVYMIVPACIFLVLSGELTLASSNSRR